MLKKLFGIAPKLESDGSYSPSKMALKMSVSAKTDFENRTKSEAFRKAHSGGGQNKGIYLGHPEFEGFEVIL